MRFQKYLYEQMETSEKLLETIKRYCQKYIKEYIRNDVFLYSGRRSNKEWEIKRIRKDRKPQDTPEEIHNIFDDAFEDVFGIRLRSNSIFCYPDPRLSTWYGNIYMIFPFGDYEIYYHPEIYDLYKQQDKYTDIKELEIKYNKQISSNIDVIVWNPDETIRAEVLKKIEENFKKLVRNEYKKGVVKYSGDKKPPEVMVYGDRYLMISEKILKQDNNFLLGEIKKL